MVAIAVIAQENNGIILYILLKRSRDTASSSSSNKIPRLGASGVFVVGCVVSVKKAGRGWKCCQWWLEGGVAGLARFLVRCLAFKFRVPSVCSDVSHCFCIAKPHDRRQIPRTRTTSKLGTGENILDYRSTRGIITKEKVALIPLIGLEDQVPGHEPRNWARLW
jgi:hypothetical protein